MRLVAVSCAALLLAFVPVANARPAMTRSEARSIARDVNLNAGDMKGYDSVPSDPATAEDRRIDASIARCAGSVPQARALAHVSSPVFLRGTKSDFDIFGSDVEVFAKATLLRKDMRALRTTRARNCLRAAVQTEASASGTPATVTVTTLATEVSGVFGYRFRTDFASSSSRGSTYSDFFFMGRRSTEARVIVNSYPNAPAQSLDDQVVRIVKTRLDTRADPNAIL